MQLNNNRKISAALITASCALLGVNQARADASTDQNWHFDTAVMYYGETERVSAVEGIIVAKKNFGEQHIFNAKLVIDTLTGASANGAIVQNTPQTFTRPSGNGQYTVEAGKVPLDDTFRDTRVQANLQWSQPVWSQANISAGVQLSNEYDYTSIAGNVSLSRDFNKRNTSFMMGLSYAADTIKPEGGIPVGLNEMIINQGQYENEQDFTTAFDNTRRKNSDESKDTVDLLFGLTQIVNHDWLLQLSYGYSQVDGYLTDPFKVVSLVNDTGVSDAYLYENRPDTKSKQSIYLLSKYHYNDSIFDLSYRFSDDDWGVSSHTLESRFRFPISNSSFIQPHIRVYSQSAADFYQPYLQEGQPIPEFVSADYRVGDLSTYTIGLKYQQLLDDGHDWGVRLEYYSQVPDTSGYSLIDEVNSSQLEQRINAVILQFSYSF